MALKAKPEPVVTKEQPKKQLQVKTLSGDYIFTGDVAKRIDVDSGLHWLVVYGNGKEHRFRLDQVLAYGDPL